MPVKVSKATPPVAAARTVKPAATPAKSSGARPSTDLAKYRQSAEFKAAVARRKAAVAASTPLDNWYPPANSEVIFRVRDYKIAPALKKGTNARYGDDYILGMEVVGVDPNAGKKFRTTYRIFDFDPTKKRDASKWQGDMGAARLRGLLEKATGEPCEDEMEWPSILDQIVAGGLTFRGRAGAKTRTVNGQPHTDYFMQTFEQVALDESGEAHASAPAEDTNGEAAASAPAEEPYVPTVGDVVEFQADDGAGSLTTVQGVVKVVIARPKKGPPHCTVEVTDPETNETADWAEIPFTELIEVTEGAAA